MKTLKVYWAGILLVLLQVGTVNAQTNLQPINLETVLEMFDARSQTLVRYRQLQARAEAEVEQAKEWWLPELYGGLQHHHLWGAAMNGNGNFFVDVDRNNLWLGLGVDAVWDFADGIYQVKGAEYRKDAAKQMTEAARSQALLKAIEAYYDLLAAQLYYESYDRLAKQADTIAQQIAIQVEAGLRYESELLLAQSNVHHMKVEMMNASLTYAERTGALVEMLALPVDYNFFIADSILAPIDLQTTPVAASEMESIYALRPEMLGLKLGMQGLEQDRRSETTAYRYPELRVNGYGSLFGRTNGRITPMQPDLVPNPRMLYPTAALNISLLWRLPTGRWVKGGDLKYFDAEVMVKKAQIGEMEARINGEVTRANGKLKAVKMQMEIALEGSRLAEKALSQSIQRQQLRTVQPLEILQAQEMFIQARLDYLSAVATFNKVQYALLVAKGERL